jgi:hypothetical protein
MNQEAVDAVLRVKRVPHSLLIVQLKGHGTNKM